MMATTTIAMPILLQSLTTFSGRKGARMRCKKYHFMLLYFTNGTNGGYEIHEYVRTHLRTHTHTQPDTAEQVAYVAGKTTSTQWRRPATSQTKPCQVTLNYTFTLYLYVYLKQIYDTLNTFFAKWISIKFACPRVCRPSRPQCLRGEKLTIFCSCFFFLPFKPLFSLCGNVFFH